jgi:hypothetical protein
MLVNRSPHQSRPPSPAAKADLAKIYRIFDEQRQWLEKLEHTCSMQFARIAQMQVELDEVRRALLKTTLAKEGRR